MDNDEAQQVIDGLLLGDGCLAPTDFSAYFSLSLSDKSNRISTASFLDYLEHIGKILDYLGIKRTDEDPKILYGKYTDGSERKKCKLSTKTHTLLRNLYGKWYGIHNGSKEVPEDFILTPLSLAYFYMGDGNLNVVKRLYNKRIGIYHTANLAMNGFKTRSVELIENQFRQFHIGTYRGNCHNNLKYGNDIRLYIRAESLEKFKDIVRPYVIQPYLYKLSGEKQAETFADKLARLKQIK